MKKLILTLVSLCLLMLCLLSMVSCSKTVDEVKNFKIDPDTLTLSWDRVLGAKNYSVQISGQDFEKSTKQNSVSLEYLEPGTYEIKIRANGDGVELKNSDWVSYTFVRETESGMRYKLINNNTEYQLVGIGTASGDIVMDDTYRGKPVTSIADKAFAGNSRITSFVVGNNVKTIGKNAFSRCAELTSITIPESVTSIGANCFQSCKKLESFAFPSSITTVEEYMFSWCSSLKTVTFSDKTETISMYAFSNCKSLEKVSLPSTLKLIEEYAFSDCASLTEADLGDSLETIQPYSFYNCISMSTLNVGSSLKIIDEYAFGNCDGLVSMVVPSSCESIGAYAFRYCDALEEVKLGDSISYIGSGAFHNTKIYNDAEEAIIIDGWYIYCKDKEITKLTLTEGIYGIANSAFEGCKELINFNFTGIKYLGDGAFYGCEKLMYALFDDSLISIGSYAFKNCKELIRVTVGTSLESIGDYAFSSCSMLQDKYIPLPDTLTSIGTGAFNGTRATIVGSVVYIGNWVVGVNLIPGNGLNKIDIRNGTVGIANYSFNNVPILQLNYEEYGINIPDSVQYIGRGAFYKAAALGYLVTVKLPANLKSIGDYAFYGCYCAQFGTDGDLVIPQETEYIGRSSFYGCESIYSLSIPGSVKEIGPYAFYSCLNIGGVYEKDNEDDPTTVKGYFTLSEGIETIGDKAFQGCSKIENVTIPDSVTTLGSRAFYKCEGLKELTIGAGLSVIPDYAFYNCVLLESLTIPEGITTIGRYAFRGCNSLTSLDLGSVSEINDFAFLGAEKLTSLVIPESVTYIGMHAFRGMTRAKSIIIPSSVDSVLNHAFYGASNAVIYVYGSEAITDWNIRWNSSYAPVITDCTLSEDKSYVVSFVKSENNPENMPIEGSITAPVREAYDFFGFSTEEGGSNAAYTIETLKDAPVGTVLYTVWTPKNTPTN